MWKWCFSHSMCFVYRKHRRGRLARAAPNRSIKLRAVGLPGESRFNDADDDVQFAARSFADAAFRPPATTLTIATYIKDT